VILIQTSRPKAKQLLKQSRQLEDSKEFALIRADPFEGDRYDLGLCRLKRRTVLFGEFWTMIRFMSPEEVD